METVGDVFDAWMNRAPSSSSSSSSSSSAGVHWMNVLKPPAGLARSAVLSPA